MQTSGWAILEQADGWWIARVDDHEATPGLARVDADAKATPHELAKAVAAQLGGLGYRVEEDCVLCLSSSECLPAKLAKSAGGETAAALAFQLEELLPLSAEQFVADFIRTDECLLGIVVEVDRVRPLVQAMEVAGIAIRSIVSATLLAAQKILQSHAEQVGTDCLLIFPSNSAYDIVHAEHGVISDWLSVRGDSSVLEQNLWMLNSGREQPTPALLCLPDAEQTDPSIADLRHYPALSMGAFPEVVAVAAGDALFGKLTPCVDLRRDKLASRSPYHSLHKLLVVATLAACLMLSATIGALECRSWCYDHSAESYQRAMEQVFQEVFPKQTPPLGIRSRLESEHSKTVSLRDTKKIPEVASAIEPFRQALAALPESVRYRFSEINIQGRQLKIEGEVRSHGDAAQLATSLSEAAFEVQPPRTVQVAGGNVTVTLNAEFRPVEKAKAEKPAHEMTSNP